MWTDDRRRIEAFTGAKFGWSGTLTAAQIITEAEKVVPVKQVGYSGLMFVCQKIVDYRCWQTGVCRHAVLDVVAQLDESARKAFSGIHHNDFVILTTANCAPLESGISKRSVTSNPWRA